MVMGIHAKPPQSALGRCLGLLRLLHFHCWRAGELEGRVVEGKKSSPNRPFTLAAHSCQQSAQQCRWAVQRADRRATGPSLMDPVRWAALPLLSFRFPVQSASGGRSSVSLCLCTTSAVVQDWSIRTSSNPSIWSSSGNPSAFLNNGNQLRTLC